VGGAARLQHWLVTAAAVAMAAVVAIAGVMGRGWWPVVVCVAVSGLSAGMVKGQCWGCGGRRDCCSTATQAAGSAFERALGQWFQKLRYCCIVFAVYFGPAMYLRSIFGRPQQQPLLLGRPRVPGFKPSWVVMRARFVDTCVVELAMGVLALGAKGCWPPR
jgi:hypothetical protein